MKKNNLKGSLILVLGALIWGLAFVAQGIGAETLDAYTFNFSRSLIASVFLIVLVAIFGEKKPKARFWGFGSNKLLIAGTLSGIFLFGAVTLQQIGIETTTAGKSAFITALYIVFAPIASMLFGKKAGVNVWLGIITGCIGMYFLCMTGESGIGKGDIALFICSLLFTGQILVIDRFSSEVDCIRMSFIQFTVCTVLSVPFMFIWGSPDIKAIGDCALPILYVGIMSSGVGYTLQIIGQKYAEVTVATLCMSLESVFAAMGGLLFQNQTMSAPEIAGCCLIFAAIVISQLKLRKKTPADD